MKTKNKKEQTVGAIKNYLDKENWNYYYNDDVFSFNFRLQDLHHTMIYYTTHVKEDAFEVRCTYPLGADVDDWAQMEEMVKFCNYVNSRFCAGALVLDPDDGEIVFRYFVSCRGVDFSSDLDPLISNSIYFPAVVFDQYGKGILGLCTEEFILAETAIKDCETENIDEDVDDCGFDEDSDEEDDETEEDDDDDETEG